MPRARAVEALFDEFAARWARGERPDVDEYLTRAGPDAGELAALVDRYLELAPVPEPDEETVAGFEAWIAGEAPVLVVRRRRGLRRADVVERLRELLSLPQGAAGKIGRYYHELETGLLDPAGVDRSVWEALREILGANVRDLAALRPAPPTVAPLFRKSAPEWPVEGMPLPALEPEAEADEEVDRLFRGPR